MANPKCYLLADKAFQYLSERANEIELLGPEKSVTNKKDLAVARIFPGVAENVYKYLDGKYPITKDLEHSICTKLRIPPAKWNEITERRTNELRPSIQRFFARFREHGLGSIVAFTPK